MLKELAKEITMKQKYNDFKEALKLVLEKSEELETIITTNQLVISEEMKEALTKIKELKHKSQEKDNIYQELASKKFQKEKELEALKNTAITNNHLEEDEIEDILEAQVESTKNSNSRRLERIKKRLAEAFNKAEIIQLCQLQTEITNLELELNKNIDQSTRQLTQMITNIGSINVEQDNFLIDKTFGEVEQQAQILKSPYGIPSFSKKNN